MTATLGGLEPGILYHYQVAVDGETDPTWNGSFKENSISGVIYLSGDAHRSLV